MSWMFAVAPERTELHRAADLEGRARCVLLPFHLSSWSVFMFPRNALLLCAIRRTSLVTMVAVCRLLAMIQCPSGAWITARLLADSAAIQAFVLSRIGHAVCDTARLGRSRQEPAHCFFGLSAAFCPARLAATLASWSFATARPAWTGDMRERKASASSEFFRVGEVSRSARPGHRLLKIASVAGLGRPLRSAVPRMRHRGHWQAGRTSPRPQDSESFSTTLRRDSASSDCCLIFGASSLARWSTSFCSSARVSLSSSLSAC